LIGFLRGQLINHDTQPGTSICPVETNSPPEWEKSPIVVSILRWNEFQTSAQETGTNSIIGSLGVRRGLGFSEGGWPLLHNPGFSRLY
jgi:hypothetical protein